MSGKIAITPRSLSRSGHPLLSQLEDKGYNLVFPSPGVTPSEEDLLKSIPGCVAWLAGVEPISQAVLDAAPDLRVISRNGTGVDNIPLDLTADRNIVVERTLGANARGVAELAITLMLSGFRQVPWSDAKMRDGKWERRIGREVESRKLGIIGCGAIGREVAKMALGLGMQVIGYDPYPNKAFSPNGFRYGSLDEIIEEADAISLHCPPADEPLLDSNVLDKAKPGLVIVNTARASLIDDDAVLAALESGTVSCLATDVFHTEPPSASDLLSHDRVIQTPHAGGLTEESVQRATSGAIDNILKVLET